mmetsp:Transcript_26477/g.76020  ORF Transcript_26477/g.76020 Transcript_26477/m.76020 type:complete len:281 (+) Transcript_26477:127-969(+)
MDHGTQAPPACIGTCLAESEEPLAHGGEPAEGRKDAGAPDFKLPWLIARQAEGGKAVRGEPTDLLHVGEQCPVGEAVLCTQQRLHKRQDLRCIVGAHGDLRQPQRLLLPAIQTLEVLPEDLMVFLDLPLHLLRGPGVGVDLDGVDDVPAVRHGAGELPAGHVECVLLELCQPAVADLDVVGERRVHPNAGVLATRVARHGGRENLARPAGGCRCHVLDDPLPEGGGMGVLRRADAGVKERCPARARGSTRLAPRAAMRRRVPLSHAGRPVEVGLVEAHNV